MVKLVSNEQHVKSVKLDMKAVKNVLRTDLKEKGKLPSIARLRKEKNTLKVLKQYILLEISRKIEEGESKNLYLNEEHIQEFIPSLSIAQIKRAKRDLSEAGILYVKKYQQGEGSYPLWLIDFDFIVVKHDRPAKKTNRKFWVYTKGIEVETAYKNIKKEVYSEMEEAGIESYPLKSFMMIVMTRLKQYMARHNLQGA